VVQQHHKDKATKLTPPNIFDIFFTMYSKEEIEFMCREGLNARIQSFTFSKYIEKFKVKCVYSFPADTFLLICLVNNPETLEIFDRDEEFGKEFLYVTTNEVRDFLKLIGFEFPLFTFELNMVRQYAH